MSTSSEKAPVNEWNIPHSLLFFLLELDGQAAPLLLAVGE